MKYFVGLKGILDVFCIYINFTRFYPVKTHTDFRSGGAVMFTYTHYLIGIDERIHNKPLLQLANTDV